MEDNIAISVQNVTLQYRSSHSYSIKNIFRREKTMINKEQGNALDDVSFDIKKGEIVGVIGRNGSGKSTLLKLLVGVFRQDSGTVNLHNNSISLAAIGVGFLGKLTGRENIILSGMLLGFSKKELLEKQDEIIGFTDLGDFIDKPVRTYSSGMYSKLAFSITAILETDIILIDEVLSVGDVKFRKKSYAKMLEIIKNKDRTVVFVSHNNQILKELCDSLIWLDNGKVKMIGNTTDVMKKYIEFMG